MSRAPSSTSAPLKILLISHEASRTGAPRVAALVARCLVAQGHNVQLVSRTRGPLVDDFVKEARTRVEFLTRVRRRFRALRIPRWIPWVVDSAVALGTILTSRPDVVYINSTAAAIYLRPAQLLHRRTILHSHESGEIAGRFLTETNAWGAAKRATVVACSPSVQREMAQIIGLPIRAVELVPSVPDGDRVLALAEDPCDIPIPDGQVVVGCCGSVEHRKGADLFIAAAAETRRLAPDSDLRFIWVGDIDPTRPPDDNESVEFVGTRANPYPIMQRFDIAALPSRDDPFPLVVLEAMMLGKPVVAYDVGAVSEQIGPTGILVTSEDVVGFAKAIVKLIEDPDVRRTMGSQAQRRAIEFYSTDAFSRRIEALVLAASSMSRDLIG